MNQYFLDRTEDVRASLKGTGVGLPVHLHDQALFDAAGTMKRRVESGKKQTHVKAKVFARFEGAERQGRRGEAEVKRWVGEAAREALAVGPSALAVTDLSDMRGRTKSRKLSPIVSRRMRSSLRERLKVRSEAGGSRLETVSAAYTRQTCPDSSRGPVHQDKRHGDRFQCPRLGHAGDADVIAFLNIAARIEDPDIHLWTPRGLCGKPHAEVPSTLGRGFGSDRSRQDSSGCTYPMMASRVGPCVSTESEKYNESLDV